MAERVILCILVCLLLGAEVGVAQTTDDVQQSLEQMLGAASETGFFVAQPGMADSLVRCSSWFARSGAGRLTPEEVVRVTTAPRPSWTDRLRWNQPSFVVEDRLLNLDPATLDRYVNAILEIVNTTGGLQEHLDAKVGPEERARLLEPFMEIYGGLLEASKEESFEVLGRYERKFGPGSTRLNLIEVVLNAGFSRLPGFGPDERGYPGAWEVVSAYSSSYLGFDGDLDEALVTSVIEIGLRHYNYGATWGSERRWIGALKPASFSFGAVLAGEPDGPLIWPWRGEERWGGFVAWGAYKAAYLFGDDEDRLLFSKQFQLLPGLF